MILEKKQHEFVDYVKIAHVVPSSVRFLLVPWLILIISLAGYRLTKVHTVWLPVSHMPHSHLCG